MADEIVLTYEKLYDILRRERDKDSLQSLDKTFFSDVRHYLAEKKAIVDRQMNSGLNVDEQQRVHQQLLNAYKLVREVFEKREHKIIMLARDDVKTNGSLIDTGSLLPEEKDYYYKLLALLRENRDLNLQTLFNGQPKPLKMGEPVDEIQLTFSEAIAAFVGPDMQEYGPFGQGETKALPSVIAGLLVKQGKAAEFKKGE